MVPDLKNYYPLERFVLHKAGIDPDDCHGSVAEAITKQLSGWQRAEAYLKQLENDYYSGDESDETIIDDGNSFRLYIHKPFAQSWQPMNEIEATEIGKKVIGTRDKSLLLMLAMFIEESNVWKKYDGTRGAQEALAVHIREVVEKRGWSGLAVSTIKRRLKQAIDAAQEADVEAKAKAGAYSAD